MTLRVLSVCASVAVLAAILAAEPPHVPSSPPLQGAAGRAEDSGLATFTTSTSSTSAGRLRPGVRVSLYVDVTPKPNIHIYAPGEKENLPITLTIPRDRAFRLGPPRLPPAQTYVFPVLKVTQLVYSKPFRIRQPLTIVNPPPTGPMTITGTVRYQACDDKVCYMPKSVELSWVVGSR
jgi:hypothetical protein